MAKALYIHIPFCNEICNYCDFPKVYSSVQKTDEYLNSLLGELKLYEKTIGFAHIETIYIGGGTPTVLSTMELGILFFYLRIKIDFSRLKEVSIEANPESLNDPEKIACLKRNGVTRVSLGVQTFSEKHLNFLQRSHSKEEVLEVIQLLNEQDFEINLDLIYAIPTQTLKEWEEDLDIALSLPITHVSAYSLILEENTKLYLDYQRKKVELVNNEIEAQMFETVIDRLTAAGFEHYEISNFTKGNRSFHNEIYWKTEPYIGIGLGAHGYLGMTKERRIRYGNTRSITAYKEHLSKPELPVVDVHDLTEAEQLEEAMFLGLRMMEGVDLHSLSFKFGINVYKIYRSKIVKLQELAYVSYEAGKLKLTKKGLMMANDVFEEFLVD